MAARKSLRELAVLHLRKWSTWVWTGFLAVGAILGFTIDFPALMQSLAQGQQPSVELKYFNRASNGTLSLEDFSRINLVVDPEDVEQSQIRLPLNIAVRNLEKSELRDAKIVFSYPAGLTVEPQGAPLINPDARTLTYEHSLRDLGTVGEFTPLDTIDTLHIHFDYVVIPSVVLTRDTVPLYILAVAGFDGRFEDKEVDIGVRIEVPGRPLISGAMSFVVKAGVQVLGLGSSPNARLRPVSPEDQSWFKAAPATAQILDTWERSITRAGPKPHLVQYTKYLDRGATYQRISVDGTTRRLLIDSNGDKLLDSEVVDSTGDGLPDTRLDGGATYMPDWPSSAAN